MSTSPREFIENIESGLRSKGNQHVDKSPVAVLIKTPNSDSLHWITVTDLENNTQNECVVTFSSEGRQYKTSCHQLQTWSYNISRDYGRVASKITYLTIQLEVD